MIIVISVVVRYKDKVVIPSNSWKLKRDYWILICSNTNLTENELYIKDDSVLIILQNCTCIDQGQSWGEKGPSVHCL